MLHCYVCKRDIPYIDGDLEVIVPEWACYLAGIINDLDDLGLDAVCPACAERLVGPDWQATGRAALAFNDACLSARRRDPDGSPRRH